MIQVICADNGETFIRNTFIAFAKDNGQEFVKEIARPVIKDPLFKQYISEFISKQWGREIKESEIEIIDRL